MNGIDLAAFLAVLAADYEITIGFEASPDKPKPQIALDLRDVTFPQIMDGVKLKLRLSSPPSEQTKDERLSFDLNGVTLRQALNRIAADSGGKVLDFRRYPDSTFEVSLW